MTFIREPLVLKQPKAKPRPDYLDAVRQLPCVICVNFGWPQTTPTRSHHVTHTKDAGLGSRGQRKTPDTMAIPLCDDHHQGRFGVHTRPAWWKAEFGLDTDYILPTQDRLAGMLAK